jgi:transposase
MTDNTNVTQKYTYIAIDVAKKNHDVLIQWPSGKRKSMRIANTLEDYSRLLCNAGGDYPIIAGFEPTADYHRKIHFRGGLPTVLEVLPLRR